MTHKEYIIPESELRNTIDEFSIKNSKVAIVGGHYILLYEKKSDSLKPAIYQEFEEWGNMTFSKKKTKNFPVKSFEMTASLFLYFKERQIESKCILLVNDDSLFQKEFRTEDHFELVKDRGRELRKKYFSSDENIPISFKKILSTFHLTINEFFAKFDNIHFTEDNLLPRETIFVSERRLCRNFKKTVKSADKTDNLFKILNIDHIETDNIKELTVEANKIDKVCLIKEGICNCGGKAFQFYFDLIKSGYDTIIFFIPDECKAQVKDGTDLICNSKEFAAKLITIINITNLDTNSDEGSQNKKLELNLYTNRLKLEEKIEFGRKAF